MACQGQARPRLGETAAVLTPYGTSFRYPGAVSEPDDADLREAITLAERWLAAVAVELGD